MGLSIAKWTAWGKSVSPRGYVLCLNMSCLFGNWFSFLIDLCIVLFFFFFAKQVMEMHRRS
jgi:hypothetical protein